MEFSLQKARSLAARTVHIKISPTPQNFIESRVVLQELEQKFGEVAMFRSLKVRLPHQSAFTYLTSDLQYHPISPVQNAVTAIFQTESAAKAALEKANHRYGLIIEPSQLITSFVGPPINPLEFEATQEDAAAGKKSEEPQQVKEFQLDIWPSDFVHERYIKSPTTNPLYGPFRPVLPENSFIGGALKQSVSPSPWARGLMDWETDAVRRKKGFGGLEAALDHNDNPVGLDGRFLKAETPFQRRHRRRQMKAAPKVMWGLRSLKEEKKWKEEEEERQRMVDEERKQREGEAMALREDVG